MSKTIEEELMQDVIEVSVGVYYVQCPVCGEKDFILFILYSDDSFDILCMSCGYNGSDNVDGEDWIYLTSPPI
jgi:ribosomal protein S27E